MIVKAVHRQMKEKSTKTRQDCFALLKELVQVLPGALTNHIPALIYGIQFSLGFVFIINYSILTFTLFCLKSLSITKYILVTRIQVPT